MIERELEPSPYWSDDVFLGDFPLPGGVTPGRLQLHLSKAAHHGQRYASPYIAMLSCELAR
jgi:hypothetical protein